MNCLTSACKSNLDRKILFDFLFFFFSKKCDTRLHLFCLYAKLYSTIKQLRLATPYHLIAICFKKQLKLKRSMGHFEVDDKLLVTKMWELLH